MLNRRRDTQRLREPVEVLTGERGSNRAAVRFGQLRALVYAILGEGNLPADILRANAVNNTVSDTTRATYDSTDFLTTKSYSLQCLGNRPIFLRVHAVLNISTGAATIRVRHNGTSLEVRGASTAGGTRYYFIREYRLLSTVGENTFAIEFDGSGDGTAMFEFLHATEQRR